MSLKRPMRLALLLGIVLALIAVAACGKKVQQVASKWPQADRERVVNKPAEPPRWPLTGLDAPSTAATLERIVSVKIENSPTARPQTGLQSADVVYEMLTEGGISRFHAMFQSKIPKAVTPVRSARMPDLQIVPQYHSILAYAGANDDVDRAISKAHFDTMDFSINPAAYYRGGNKPAPHNLWLDVAKLRRDAIAKRKYAATAEVRPFAFSASVDTTASATRIDIPFSPANRVLWTYDAASHWYLRTNNGKVHTDAGTGKQIHANNVVVMWAKMTQLKRRDVTGSPTYSIEMVGKNRATVFRDGVRIDGTWEAGTDAPPVFRAQDGTLIKLKTGNTWFQVVPSQVNIKID